MICKQVNLQNVNIKFLSIQNNRQLPLIKPKNFSSTVLMDTELTRTQF